MKEAEAEAEGQDRGRQKRRKRKQKYSRAVHYTGLKARGSSPLDVRESLSSVGTSCVMKTAGRFNSWVSLLRSNGD
jgi:hypothetical protein